MKTNTPRSYLKIASASAMLLALAACDNDNEPSNQQYNISITNITHAQPLSPPVAMLHNDNFSFWKIGDAASLALERMAEGGDGSALLDLRKNNPQFQGDKPLFAGEFVEFILTSNANLSTLSVTGMLINTNDAFSGLTGIELASLQPGQSTVYYTYAYDAGTEFNSELPGTIPGPADGGEGFNLLRDDVTEVVTFHGGVVGAEDNFSASTLSGADKFDNPTLRIVVTAL